MKLIVFEKFLFFRNYQTYRKIGVCQEKYIFFKQPLFKTKLAWKSVCFCENGYKSWVFLFKILEMFVFNKIKK